MSRSALLAWLAASGLACGYGYEMRSTAITGAPMLTSGPAVGEPELSRTIGDLSQRLATEVCRRELLCGNGTVDASCVNDTVERARRELTSWNCSPAATRARVEECLAGIDEESCELDLSTRARLCRANDACGVTAELISPGAALAEQVRSR